MKSNSIYAAAAVVCCVLGGAGYAQTTDTSHQTGVPAETQPLGSMAPVPGAEELAKHVVPARAVLERTLDADKDATGASFEAKLSSKMRLEDGTEIPKGATLLGEVADDDMNVGGSSKLALRFTKIRMKDGSTVPVQVTIVGMYPAPLPTEVVPDDITSDWKPSRLVLDQVGVLKGVDLHSRIGGRNSGTLVSSTKSEMKLGAGVQFALVIGPAQLGAVQAALPRVR